MKKKVCVCLRAVCGRVSATYARVYDVYLSKFARMYDSNMLKLVCAHTFARTYFV